RRDIYEDALEAIVKGLRNERLTHRGPYYRYDNVPMELRPKQEPHPAFWYGSITDESARHAARYGMNMISLGPIQLVKRVTAVYREHIKESIDSPKNVNAHVKTPKVGVTRHIYVADSDS